MSDAKRIPPSLGPSHGAGPASGAGGGPLPGSDYPSPAHWQPVGDDEIDLFELWDILWSGKWLIILMGLLCTVAAVAYALQADEIYEAKVVMVPAEDGSGSGGLAALAGQFGGLASLAGINLGGGGSASATALETLESFRFTAEFIKEKDLAPVLFADRWDAANQNWILASAEEKPPTLQEAVKAFAELRQISSDKQSGAVTLTMAWTDPTLAADWANALVQRLNDGLRARDVREAQRAVAYLEARIAETANVDMRATLYKLIESQTQKIMLAKVRDDYVFQVVDPAFAPEQRAKPKRSLIVVLGGMLGGMLGVMLVFGRRVVHSYQARSAEAG